MDLIYTDAERADQGVLRAYALDLSYGKEENDFEITLGEKDARLETGAFVYVENTEYGGMVDGLKTHTDEDTIIYKGRTWHGILNSKVIEPATEDDFLPRYFTITPSVAGGTATPASATVRKGRDVTFTFTPNSGSTLKKVIVDDVEIDVETFGGSYTFENVTSSHTISVIYAKPSILPDGYTHLEYLTSDGNAYIDTGIAPDQNTKFEVDLAFLGSNGTNIAGVRNTSSDSINRFGLITFSSTGKIGAFFGATQIQGITTNTSRHSYILSKSGLYIDGTQYGSAMSNTFSCAYGITLFGFRNGSTSVAATKSRTYFSKCYQNNVLVQHLVACRNPDGVLGMYDLVSKAFYKNAGSGSFTAGSEYYEIDSETGGSGDSGDSDNTSGVTVEQTGSDGETLLDKYLVISGDANACLGFVIEKLRLFDLFEVSTKESGINISKYQFARFCKGYDGICAMLKAAGAKLQIAWKDKSVVLSAVPADDYTESPVDGDVAVLAVDQTHKKVNHLVCLGQGELAEREILHLYADESGAIGDTQYYTGLDEITEKYENTNAESADKLREEGIKRFKELRDVDKAEISLEEVNGIAYDIGDIVGATDIITGTNVTASVTQKIVRINNGVIDTEYKVGG